MVNKLSFQSSNSEDCRELHIHFDGTTVIFKISSSTTSAEFSVNEAEIILENVKRMISKRY